MVKHIYEGTFENCISLHELNFKGTKKQWHNIEKDPDWCKGSAIKLIKCIDGNINL